ncbi:AvrD family protein [Streptomyces sp. NPDC059491]|uniref:AvrD family protein n=1 Tax=Streptomyces sp. NPDC059491 TaxID=3346850 RepID=UPI0036C91B75
MNTSSAPPRAESIDDLLGPAGGRFFGRGFRRVAYDIGDVRLARGPQGTTTASTSVGVRYPADWSKKKAGSDLRPHFSTVDGIVIAAQLAEACLGGPGADLRDAWLRSVRLSAGSAPQEDLDGLRAEATVRGTEPVPRTPGRSVSRVDCAIGTMRVRLEVEHSSACTLAAEQAGTALDALLGPAGERYFGTGFTRRTQHIRRVDVDPERLRASSALTLAQDDATVPRAGLEGAFQPSVSMIDAFVTVLQLAQIMLYDLDGMRRQDSNTLWMRQTTLTASRPDRGDTDLTVEAALEDAQVHRMRGETWRTLDITGELPGLTVRSAVAHQLPEGHVAP